MLSLLLCPPLLRRVLIASIMEEYNRAAWEQLVERCQEAGVDGFELNFRRGATRAVPAPRGQQRVAPSGRPAGSSSRQQPRRSGEARPIQGGPPGGGL